VGDGEGQGRLPGAPTPRLAVKKGSKMRFEDGGGHAAAVLSETVSWICTVFAMQLDVDLPVEP